jgi:chromosome segregation ATPase
LVELKKEAEEAAEYARDSKAMLAEEISELRQQLTDSTTGVSAKSAEAEKLTGEINSLSGELAKLKEANTQLQASNVEYTGTISKLKVSDADLVEQLKMLRANMAQELNARDAKASALDAQLARKGQEGTDMEEKVQKLKSTVSDLESQVQKHLQEIARLNDGSRRELEKARDDREYQENRLKAEVDTLKQEIYNLKDTNLQLKQEKDSQVRSIEESYQRRLTERQEKISNLEDQLGSLKEMKQRFEGMINYKALIRQY